MMLNVLLILLVLAFLICLINDCEIIQVYVVLQLTACKTRDIMF